MTLQFAFDNTYSRLPDRFHARLDPTKVAKPELIRLNTALAAELGLDAAALSTPEGVAVLAGNTVPDGSTPLAMAYAGHQFGNFVPQLGDGRALLLGEIVDGEGKRRDIQLKGAGPTPFSRGGDGRAGLGPVLREYIVSEAMNALGIPTTRALAAVLTGEPVLRDRVLPGAVLTRVASSHIRVGTFQYFAVREDIEALGTLTDYVIKRHYPETAQADNPPLALVDKVVEAQSSLVAQWMGVGFIHGVMNTDNMTISGETIDYGPCAFLDAYDPAKVFSSIDQFGRYAFANQFPIAVWNVARLAETLLPLINDDEDKAVKEATDVVNGFSDRFSKKFLAVMGRKLGLTKTEDSDLTLVRTLLDAMKASTADYTLTFRTLSETPEDESAHDRVRNLFIDPTAYDAWRKDWEAILAREPGSASDKAQVMRNANPAYIPRNHRVEQAIQAAEERRDFGPFETLVTVLSKPYEDQPAYADYAKAPRAEELVKQTFCGT